MAKNLTALFNPKSVALIGASRSPEKLGAIVLKNLISSKFPGPIYPINPQADTIGSLKCYPDIGSLPETPDLAIIALPAKLTLEILPQIGEEGVKNVVVFAAGFKEAGVEGEALEKELIDLAKRYDLNLLGPNCLGFVNNLCPINATFGELVNTPGNLRFISQSGAIASSIFDFCKSNGMGFSEFITLGNKSVISENDVLEYFQARSVNMPAGSQEDLSSVYPIGLYLESITNGSEFLRITSEISKINPIFILKPGKTAAAAQAMHSHTGAIAGEDAVLEAALRQAGVLRCETLEDFFDFSRAFAFENAPLGPKVAIISNAGGPAVVSTDAVVKEGLELAQFNEETKEKLAKMLPRSASGLNPVDVLGDALADRFAQASEIVLQSGQVDALIVILTPQVMTQIAKTAQSLGDLSRKYHKPILCSFIGGSKVFEGEEVLNKLKIPVFRFPERAIAAVSAMWKFRKRQQEEDSNEPVKDLPLRFDLEKISTILENATCAGHKTLDNLEANEIISLTGISTPPTMAASNLDQAKAFTEKFGWPVVLKLSSPGLLHKKSIGGVIVGVRNEDHLQTAWETLQRRIYQLETAEEVKIQIQKDITSGVEVIVGVKRDPTFGPVVLFGAGGTFAELISDKNLRLLPISFAQVKSMVEKSKIYPLLHAGEDEPPLALDKLYDVILRLSKMAASLEDIAEIEINPLIVTLNDVWAIDGKVVLTPEEQPKMNSPHSKQWDIENESNSFVRSSSLQADEAFSHKINQKFQIAAVTGKTILANRFNLLELQTNSPFVFKPGQYISVKVSPDRINCYSLAGSSGENKFNLLVDTTPGGPGSKFFDNLKVGDKVTYLGPFGNFNLNLNDGAKNILFLATGSGFAPLKSMIEDALAKQNSKIPMTLYLGFSTARDVFGQNYFQNLSRMYPNFKYKVMVDVPSNNWKGPVGFITKTLKEDFPDVDSFAAYLCGNKAMIASAIKILMDNGCPKSRIYTEKL